jgi:hypothetical protein
MGLGGIWSNNLSGWKLKGSRFTVPATGNSVTVQVTDTAGLAAGSTNLSTFQNSRDKPTMAVSALDVATSTVTLTTVYGNQGTVVSANADFEMAATYALDRELPIFSHGIQALLNDGGQVVLALPQRTDFLPLYDQQSDQTLAYATWGNAYDKLWSVPRFVRMSIWSRWL